MFHPVVTFAWVLSIRKLIPRLKRSAMMWCCEDFRLCLAFRETSVWWVQLHKVVWLSRCTWYAKLSELLSEFVIMMMMMVIIVLDSFFHPTLTQTFTATLRPRCLVPFHSTSMRYGDAEIPPSPPPFGWEHQSHHRLSVKSDAGQNIVLRQEFYLSVLQTWIIRLVLPWLLWLSRLQTVP